MTAEQTRAALIGAWRLHSVTFFDANGGTTHPFGDRPDGQISYGADGHMSAHLVKSAGATGAPVSDYTSYFGRFSVDAERRVVTHHVDGASHKPLIGVDQPRAYILDGERLTLASDLSDGRAELVWRRLRPAGTAP